MKRIGSGWVVVASLLCALGCSEAVYVLGQLPVEGPADANTSDGAVSNGDASAGTGGVAGTSGSGGTGGIGGTGGASGVGGSDACVPRTADAQRRGLNFYLMVDSSFAFALQPIWDQTKQAITMFVDDASNAGVGVGINYYGTSCSASVYANARVPIAPLPGVASAIKTSYPALPIDGLAGPIGPPVDGAIAYASGIEAGDPDRQTDVLLISDGVFDVTCADGIAEAISYAGIGFTSRPSVRTHVIAIDSGLLAGPIDLSPLDSLAAAGGTTAARRVDVSLTATSALYEALMQTKAAAMPCEFKVPDGFDPTRTVLEWRASGDPEAAPALWARVSDRSACATNVAAFPIPGSRYVELCPNACEMIESTPAGTLRFREECP